ILLIDTLYDRKKRLFMSAAAMPDNLYAGRAGAVEAFEFDRTASRLMEMQSKDWLDGWVGRFGNAPSRDVEAAASGPCGIDLSRMAPSQPRHRPPAAFISGSVWRRVSAPVETLTFT